MLRRTDVTNQHLASNTLRHAAQIIAAARKSLKPLTTLPQQFMLKSIEDGYRIQSEVHQLLATELNRPGFRGGRLV
jgi:2-keto-4-pentenoate hydratase